MNWEMEVKLKGKYIAWIAAALLLWIGLSYSKLTPLLWAMIKPTSQFIPYPADPRVLYEPGAEELARVTAQALPQAIQTVEQKQYRPFAGPVRVYVCASIKTFMSYGGAETAGGFALNKRLFISPKPQNTAERLPRVTTHELSHLHLEQQLGSFTFASLPVWFQEGLATYVSNGAGAENVSEEQARQSIAQGKHFLPETTGGLRSRKSAHTYALDEHMFYRQSAMFIAYLKNLDETKFKVFMFGVEDGKSLETAFGAAYHQSIDTAWRGFVAEASKPSVVSPISGRSH